MKKLVKKSLKLNRETLLALEVGYTTPPFGLLLFTTIAVNAALFVALLVRWGYFPVATG